MKKAISITLLMFMLLFLPACQPTPEKDIVIGEEHTREAAEAPETDVHEMLTTFPSHYDETIEKAGPYTTIVYDADITIPEFDTLKTIKVKRRVFPDEQIMALIDELSHGETLYPVEPFTKEFIEAHTFKYEQNLRESGASEEEIQAEMMNWRQSYPYASAPNEADREPFVFPKAGESGQCKFDFYNPPVRSQILLINGHNYIWYSKYVHGLPQEETDVFIGGSISWEPYGTTIEVNLTKEEAQPLADEWVQKLVGDDFSLENVERARIVDASCTIRETGWSFTYTRNTSLPVYSMPGAFVLITGISGPTMVSPWDLEYINVLVNENGLVSMLWQGACDYDSTIDEAASVLPFEDIIPAATNVLKCSHAYSGTERYPVTITVHDIKLGSALLAIPDMLDEYGQYVPVWYVFYNIHYANNENAPHGSDFSGCITIKADDGRYVEPRMTLAAAMAGS